MKVKEIKWLSDLQKFLDSLEITNEQKDKIRSYITNDLLAQKEDRKECKHELGDKEEHDHLGTYHITGDTCVKCGKHIMDWDNSTPSLEKECKCSCHKLNPVAFACTECQKNHPTPSPLEGFEEIDDIDWVTPAISKVELAKKFNWLNRNQKKLYQYIKSLKEKK